jgi:hypothetical protein
MILAVDSIDGIIKIGSPPEELPGILESIEISGALLIENAPLEGRSGKIKIVQGWDDAALRISMSLIDDPGAGKTRWDSLKKIAEIFRKVSGAGKPEVYTLNHPMTASWGTKQLLFSDLKSVESRTRRKIDLTLEFVEYDGVAGIVQDRQGAANEAAKKEEAAPVTPIVSDRQRRGLGTLENRYGNV